MLLFFVVLLILESLVILQFVTAYDDGYFNQKQMRANGVMNGWSIMEHGGMWADFFLVSPMVAYIVCKYNLAYAHWWTWCLFVAIGGLVDYSLMIYEKGGSVIPEAHTHGGKTMLAGYIHAVYVAFAMWVLVLSLLAPVTPQVSHRDLIIIVGVLTVWAPLGVIKFNPRWKWTLGALSQVMGEIGVLWTITSLRLLFW